MKRGFLFFLIFLALILQVSVVFGDEGTEGLECEYAGKYEQCRIAQLNNAPRSITDFICPSDPNPEGILDQIILDVKFTEIDEEVEQYLVALQNDKDKYFGANKEETVLQAIDDITKNFGVEGVYYKKYKELCNGGILKERAKCTQKIPNPGAALRIKGSDTSTACLNLVNFKLDVFSNVAYTTLKINKSEVNADAHKKYVQQERTKYDALLSDMQAILGYIGNIADGVTHWTPNPLQSSLFRYLSYKISQYI